MTTIEAEQVLSEYNAWRRYDGMCDGPDRPDPIELGQAIDLAIAVLKTINRTERVEAKKPDIKLDIKEPEKEYYGG